MERIYISYSRADAEFANELASSLSKRGLYVWIEDEAARKNKKPGVDFGETLDPYDVMLVIVSPDSMASPLVEAEWRYFRKQRKPVIPLLWRPTTMSYTLHGLHYVDFYKQSYEIALNRLHQRLAYRFSSGNVSHFFTDYAWMHPVSIFIRTHLPWIPLAGAIACMASYLLACLPPGKRFIYPLAHLIGTAPVADPFNDIRITWIVFLFTCGLLVLLPLFLRDYVYKPGIVIIRVVMLIGCCYLPYFSFAALYLALVPSNWEEVDTANTANHRFYLMERSFGYEGIGVLILICDPDGVLCELIMDDYLRDPDTHYLFNWRGQPSLEVVGDTINVRDGSAVVFTIPIP